MQNLLLILTAWRRRSRLRRVLASIDRRSLRDAGIDPGFADYEAAQPFWRAPVKLRSSAPARTAPAIANDHPPASSSQSLRAIATSRK